MSDRKILLQSPGPKTMGEKELQDPHRHYNCGEGAIQQKLFTEKHSYCAEARSLEEMLTSFSFALPPPGSAIHWPDPTRRQQK